MFRSCNTCEASRFTRDVWPSGICHWATHFYHGMISKAFQSYGFIGFLIIVVAEILLFAKVKLIGWFFTPIVWTGYILLVDSLVFKIKKESRLATHRKEFFALALLSIFFWYIFEFYNLFLNSWHYIGMPTNKVVRYFGYFWSFATIWPAILETAELVQCLKFFRNIKIKARKISPAFLIIFSIIGFVSLILPLLVYSPYLIIFVWMGFVLFLEPINYWWGEKSLLKDWEQGELTILVSLFTSGLICGILWEFWNYWATAKWFYTVPYGGDTKIFEMPIVGYLGFLPFACECYVMYNFSRGFWNKIILHKTQPVSEREVEFVKEGI